MCIHVQGDASLTQKKRSIRKMETINLEDEN